MKLRYNIIFLRYISTFSDEFLFQNFMCKSNKYKYKYKDVFFKKEKSEKQII